MAEDPGAPSFVRLARAYRRQGRRQAAHDVVVAGLGRQPEHVDAHALLALLHVETGDRERARDEWETVLRLDPGSFDASRGLGFLALERGELPAARRHLDAAARARPDDPAVRQARDVLTRRESGGGTPEAPDDDDDAHGAASGAAAGARRLPAAVAPAPAQAAAVGTAAVSAPADTPAGTPAARPRERSGGGAGADPLRLFDPLAGDGPFLGALLLDEQGLVVAGSLDRAGGEPELLVGMLSTVVEEARRTAELMQLGEWQGMLLDGDELMLHVAPLRDSTLVVAARRGAPAGWVVRTAGQAHTLAHGFLEGGP